MRGSNLVGSVIIWSASITIVVLTVVLSLVWFSGANAGGKRGSVEGSVTCDYDYKGWGKLTIERCAVDSAYSDDAVLQSFVSAYAANLTMGERGSIQADFTCDYEFKGGKTYVQQCLIENIEYN